MASKLSPDIRLATERLSRMQNEKISRLWDNLEAFVDMSFIDMAQTALDTIGDGVLVVNSVGQVVYLNKIAEKMTGWSIDLALGHAVEEIFHVIDSTSLHPCIPPSLKAIKEDHIVELALGKVLIRHDGTGIAIEDAAVPIHNYLGTITGAVIIFHDAELSRFTLQKLSHLAQHDPLTGLPNRILLAERLTQAIGMAKRHSKLLALLFVDLDHFKQVNDTLGHATGDLLLQDVAATILDCVRTTDTVSRHGGDEFVILLSEIENSHDPVLIAEKLHEKFAHPHTISGIKLKVALSIGISVYPVDGMNADALMRNADIAMYASKERNRRRCETPKNC